MDRESGQGVVSQDLGSAGRATWSAFHSAPPSTVLVTGASGFLGSAIAAALRARGPRHPRSGASLEPRTKHKRGGRLCEGDLRVRLVGRGAKGAPPFFTRLPIIGCGRETRRR